MQASVPNARRGFPASSQLLSGEAPAGAAASRSSQRPMSFHLSLNPFTADRVKIRIPDKGLGKEGSAGHTCAPIKSREGKGSLKVVQAGRHGQGGRPRQGSASP